MAVFDATGSVNAAAKASGISHASARRVLVDTGLISKERQPYGKPAARARLFELLALAVVGGPGGTRGRGQRAHGPRLGDGIRKVGNTRIRPDGTVIHYSDSVRYTHPVTPTAALSAPEDQ